jgi:hypothetical protein
MYKIPAFLMSLLFCNALFAKNTYQIDMIFFAHPQSATEFLDLNTPLLPISKNAITLKNSSMKTNKLYTLLPPSQSDLHDEFYLLSKKSQFKVLGQYSWRQTSDQQNKVSLPKLNNKGWLMQGTLEVKQGNYYSLNADLQFSPPSKPDAAFLLSQKQRIEGGKRYYLDNPYVGIVVKIHQVA